MKIKPIRLADYPQGYRSDFYLPLHQDSLGQPIYVPFIVARGKHPGHCLGVSAAVHGNELNGIKIIQHTLDELNLRDLRGSLICAPVVNVPGFSQGTRRFSDGVDLNHVFPGSSKGIPAEQYARAFVKTFLPSCDSLVDIHTASEGRVNTMYVRADMQNDAARMMAESVNAQIVLHVRGGDGTLRGAARRKNIAAVTLEAGNPAVIQGKMVYDGEIGIRNIMIKLGMLEGECQIARTPTRCKSSMWLRTTGGGLLETEFQLGQLVKAKQLLARTVNPFGQVLHEYFAPRAGIVIGKAVNPVAVPGTRFCHLGELEPEE